AMWNALHEIARREKCKVHDICSLIHLRKNQNTSLTAAIRVFLRLYYRAAATEDGHNRAGHGNFRRMVARARIPEAQNVSLSELRRADLRKTGLEKRALQKRGVRPGVLDTGAARPARTFPDGPIPRFRDTELPPPL